LRGEPTVDVVVEWIDVVLPGLLVPFLLQGLQLLRVLCRKIVGLGEILVQAIGLPDILLERKRSGEQLAR